ncbi:unnamed protein product [Rotaria socialis]|uniref:Globin-sensor domain-containing protein n=1 Tax=Rotaria socialis TaxID=392032 RepID=A0A821VPB2_9BILA|nr:unnamed protein product [Rotaria socialis]CAF4910650.1 unnamed protein product [Rotaria socialis]
MSEHIDKKLLDDDIIYRFEYLSKFLNFTENDIATLNAFEKIIQPVIPSAVEGIYQKLLNNDVTKQYFLKQNYGFEGIMTTEATQVTVKSDQMIFRINSMRKYLLRVLRQRIWNDAFLNYLSNVGKMHTNMTGASSINVDYVHINALFGHLEHILIDAVLSSDELDGETKKATILALNKLFWIQNDFFARHYIIASKNGN